MALISSHKHLFAFTPHCTAVFGGGVCLHWNWAESWQIHCLLTLASDARTFFFRFIINLGFLYGNSYRVYLGTTNFFFFWQKMVIMMLKQSVQCYRSRKWHHQSFYCADELNWTLLWEYLQNSVVVLQMLKSHWTSISKKFSLFFQIPNSIVEYLQKNVFLDCF